MELHNDSKNNPDHRKILAALMVYISETSKRALVYRRTRVYDQRKSWR